MIWLDAGQPDANYDIVRKSVVEAFAANYPKASGYRRGSLASGLGGLRFLGASAPGATARLASAGLGGRPRALPVRLRHHARGRGDGKRPRPASGKAHANESVALGCAHGQACRFLWCIYSFWQKVTVTLLAPCD